MTPTTIASNTKIQLGAAIALIGGIISLMGMMYKLSDDYVTKELFSSELGSMRRETSLQFDALNRRISDLSTALESSRQKQQ